MIMWLTGRRVGKAGDSRASKTVRPAAGQLKLVRPATGDVNYLLCGRASNIVPAAGLTLIAWQSNVSAYNRRHYLKVLS